MIRDYHTRMPTRRSFLLKSAAGAGSLWLAARWPRMAAAQDRLIVPPWDAVPACAASNTDGAGQGPFFVHNRERADDVDMFRQDIRGRYRQDAEPGTEMQLHLRILNSAAECRPVAGIDVYVWHTDAQGYYSGFGEPGEQTPDVPSGRMHGPKGASSSSGQCVPPLHDSEMSHGPRAGRHSPRGRSASGGQSGLVPSHASGRSHPPIGGRQISPAGRDAQTPMAAPSRLAPGSR